MISLAILTYKFTDGGMAVINQIEGFKSIYLANDEIEVSDSSYYGRALPYAYASGVADKWQEKYLSSGEKAPQWFRTPVEIPPEDFSELIINFLNNLTMRISAKGASIDDANEPQARPKKSSKAESKPKNKRRAQNARVQDARAKARIPRMLMISSGLRRMRTPL
jgi:hypothetical protein